MSQLLSEQTSQQLVNSIVDIAEKIALEKVKQSRKRYLIQKEVMEEYNVTHKVITEWEMMGLRKVKIGKTIRYDRQDIENVIEQMKKWSVCNAWEYEAMRRKHNEIEFTLYNFNIAINNFVTSNI